MGKEKGREIIVGSGGVKVEQFWKDNGNKVLAVTAAVGAGAAALLLVKAFFDAKRRRKIETEVAVVSIPQFVEVARELGEDNGHELVAAVAGELAEQAGGGELSEALGAVAAIAFEKSGKKKLVK
jgi:hypothetical protein